MRKVRKRTDKKAAAAALRAKIEVRENVMRAVLEAGAVGNDGLLLGARVFDAFAGEGEMFRAIWRLAQSYVGCDLEYRPRDGRTLFAADNRRVLRAIDLQPFNIFDLDAAGSPYDQAVIIAARRRVSPAETIGLVLTDSAMINLKLGAQPNAFAELTGVKTRTEGMARAQDFLVDRAIAELARRMRSTIVGRWEARPKSPGQVRFMGIVLKGAPAAGAGLEKTASVAQGQRV